MRVLWKKLFIDTILCITLPVWIVPAVIIVLFSWAMNGFIDTYTQSKD